LSLAVIGLEDARSQEMRDENTAFEKGTVASFLKMGNSGLRMSCESGTDSEAGFRVIEILDNGPAQNANLQPGDLIVAINGDGVSCSNDLEMLRSLMVFGPGDRLALRVLRAKGLFDVRIELGKMPSERAVALAKWMERAVSFYEQGGCDPSGEESGRKDEERAQKRQWIRQVLAFRDQVPGEGLDLVVSRQAGTGELAVRAENAATAAPVNLAANFDLFAVVPPNYREPIGRLRANDALRLRFSVDRARNELVLEPIAVPPYISFEGSR
jgi:hypothetical protein